MKAKVNMKKCTDSTYSIDEDRRIQFERRQFSYADIIPERRSGNDRRLPAASAATVTMNRYDPLPKKWFTIASEGHFNMNTN